MFRHYRVIFRELVFITSPSYISISIAAVGNAIYIPGKHDSGTNIQMVYTATTQIDFVRIVTIMILPHFISNWTILMF